MGDHTICESPSSRDVGTTSSSMTRQSMEYCGWEEMSWNPRSCASAWPARIWSAVHSETPMYRALPWRTMSANACIVSSSGVSVSYRCAW